MTQQALTKPQPRPVELDRAATAIAVLDLSVRCDDPKEVCSQLMGGLGAFLDRARAADVPIIFTVSLSAKDTPMGVVATALERRESEPVLYPDAYDKFYGGQLQAELTSRNVRHLVIAGSSTNVAVMYTATAAARAFRYNVVIPLDGVNASRALEHDYALHQLTVIPGASGLIAFTTLDTIQFR